MLYCLLGFGFLITNITMQFQKFAFFPILHLFLFLSILSFSISFIHSISLPSSFFPLSLSLSLSHFSPSSLHILHLLSSLSILCLFSLSSFPHLNLAIIFLSLALSLLRYSGIFSVIDLPYSLLYLDSLILSFISYFSVSLSFSLSSTFIHLPFALNLSTSSLAYLFLW
jgi:hypothetical protein